MFKEKKKKQTKIIQTNPNTLFFPPQARVKILSKRAEAAIDYVTKMQKKVTKTKCTVELITFFNFMEFNIETLFIVYMQ